MNDAHAWSRRAVVSSLAAAALALAEPAHAIPRRKFDASSPRLEDQLEDLIGSDPFAYVTVVLSSRRTLTGRLVEVGPTWLVVMVEFERIRVEYTDMETLTYLGTEMPGQAAAAMGAAAVNVVGVLVGVGVLAAVVLLVIGLIALAAKSSCPFVVVVDRRTGQRRLWGEAYSGAILASLARFDLMPLPAQEDDQLTLALENQAPETQYTDAAWVEVVDAPPGKRVLATHDARQVAVGDPVAADHVVDLDGVDQTARVAPGTDTTWATPLLEASQRHPLPQDEGLVARWGAAPAGATLELHLQTSPWLDRLSMLAQATLGPRLERLQLIGQKPETADRATELLQRSGIHTRVEVRQGDGWRTVAWIPPVGWVGPRRIAVPLDGVVAGQPLDVRISGGVGFLIVHELALAVSTGLVTGTAVAATTAKASWGPDETELLAAVDGRPDVLAAIGDTVTLDFELPPRPADTERWLFLRTHGYYEVHPPDDIPTDRRILAGIRKPERFGQAGLALFARTLDDVLARA